MTLLGRNLLLKPDDKEETSVIITDTDPTPSEYATVDLIGTQVDIDSTIKEGSRVWWNNRAGRFVTIDNVEYVLISVDDIFAVL